MITILVVGPEAVGREAPSDPAVEVLHATGVEQAIERLARNRRIDAVLLLCGRRNAEVMAAIEQEEPTPPPFYAPAQPPPPSGVRPLRADSIERLLEAIETDLGK